MIIDTNVLSLLARAHRLDLLQHLAVIPHCVTLTIYYELSMGVTRGAAHLNDALQLVTIGNLQMLSPDVAEQNIMQTLPAVLAAGETEAITLC